MKKTVLVLGTLLLLACGNKEVRVDEEKVEVNRESAVEKQGKIEKLNSIERFTMVIDLDQEEFREKLSQEVNNILDDEKKKKAIEELIKDPELDPSVVIEGRGDYNSKEFYMEESESSSIIIDDTINAREEYIRYLKNIKAINPSFDEGRINLLISSVLVDILEGDILDKLDEMGQDTESSFFAIYLLPNNEFTEVEVYLGISTFILD